MNGRSLGLLGLAVVCGLGAMLLTTRMMGKKGGEVETVAVLVAARDLKVEEVLKPDTLRVERIAKSAAPAGTFSQAKDVEDRWVQVAVLEGEPLIDRKLAPKGTPPGLIARIPKGMRAFAIEVNEQTGVSGFVLPDHRVDVVQLEPTTNGNSNNNLPVAAETVLQDVLVLASGTTFTRPDDRSIQSKTVTLAVNPEQVDDLVAARSRGPLSLSLRGLNDHAHAEPRKKPEPPPAPEPKEEPAVVVKAFEPPPPPPPAPEPAPPPPDPKKLHVYRGPGTTAVPVDRVWPNAQVAATPPTGTISKE